MEEMSAAATVAAMVWTATAEVMATAVEVMAKAAATVEM